jgi:hypothetical protein
MTSLPLLGEARVLLYVSLALPIVVGVIARLGFFRLDADDARLHPESKLHRGTAQAHDPDPEPAYRTPWPSFELTPGPRAVELAAPIIRETQPAFVYRGFGADRDAVRTVVERVWNRLAADREIRSRWPLDWSGSAPYVLAGAQGAAGASATLTVTLRQNRDEAVLREIWQQEILPELRQEFGANHFQSG